jgi:hypothetical protein
MDVATQTVILAVAGFLGGGLVVFVLSAIKDYLLRERKWLGAQIEARCLVHRDDPELKITYKGNEVNRIVLHNIRLRNIGNRVLQELPFILQTPAGLSGYRSAATSSDGVMVSYFEAPSGLGVKCALIKPGDEVAIAFSAFDCPNEDVKIILKQAEVDLKMISSSDTRDQVLDILIDNSGGVTRMLFQLFSLALKRNR